MDPKHIYETTFIINPSLDDLQIDGVIGQVQSLITNNGGEILALNKLGRKRLAYPIRKKNNGFYVSIEFKGSPNFPAQLERHFQLDENIMRYLTVQLDARALEALKAAPPPAVEEAAVPEEPLVGERAPLFTDDEDVEEIKP